MAALAFLLGLLAVFGALRARRPLAAKLGRSWLVRFLLVQAVLINGVLLAVIYAIANSFGWRGPIAVWLVPIGYFVLFYFYSISNIDWTAKKFHSEGG